MPRLAAPMLVTMLVVDLAMGFVSKTVPQINVMSAGMSMRSAIGMVVLIAGLTLTNDVLRGAVADSMDAVQLAWTSRDANAAATAGH